ncbi:MAG: formylglycine-generating enzyme family protein, partial [Nitrospira sp.]|nr:formylglycine-generating enzyme family protein [Nitrospira sp.]
EGTKRASFLDEFTSRLRSFGLSLTEETIEQNFLRPLVRSRLVRGEEVEGRVRYELTHEFLVQKIGTWIEESERELKQVLELIDRAYEAYQVTQLLLEPEALELIGPFREELVLPAEKQAFLTLSRQRARTKRRGLRLKVALSMVVVALIIGGVAGYYRYRENLRIANKIGFLEIKNPSGASLTLYRVTDQNSVERMELRKGIMELKAGGYYIKALQNNQEFKYPVYITGYNHRVKVGINFPENLTIFENMAYIPGGVFRMGDKDATDNMGTDYEKPDEDIFVKPFYMDKYEVTVGAYKKFLNSAAGEAHRPGEFFYRNLPEDYLTNPDYENRPIVQVTWQDARAYCEWLGKRLPTEAEWEKAASGPESYKYAYGNRYDWSKASTEEESAQNVGSYPPNGYGLFDMTGNISEWTSTLFRPYPYR